MQQLYLHRSLSDGNDSGSPDLLSTTNFSSTYLFDSKAATGTALNSSTVCSLPVVSNTPG